ncbi:MAG TPA: MYXO-CTERM sorting domain-containing protein [Myxococcales bacterium]|nr:MYXO-CTERM sorting domain-containing protein [Myxococcales bacterium]
MPLAWLPMVVQLAWAGGQCSAFPSPYEVVLPASQPNDIVLAGGFGLFVSSDDGVTWWYQCLGVQQCPRSGYAYGADGTLFADLLGYPDGGPETVPAISTDLACGWTASAGLSSSDVWAAAFDPTAEGHLLVLSSLDGGSGTSAAFPSVDDGATFGRPVYATHDSLSSLAYCASEPGSLYLAGNGWTDGGATGVPFLVQGLDGGATWSPELEHPELAQALGSLLGDAGPGADGASNPRISLVAVDPADCGTVYLRLTTPAGEGLAVSHDRGATLQLVFTLQGGASISGVAVGADGTTFVATGCSPARDCPDHGLWAASPGNSSFQRVSPIDATCLGVRGDRLYACGDDGTDGFALGVSTDDGKTFMPVVRFSGIDGIATCPGSPLGEACEQAWCGPAGLAEALGVDAGCGLDAGPAAAPSVSPPPKGCGCGTGDSAGWLSLLLGIPLAPRTRRRNS